MNFASNALKRGSLRVDRASWRCLLRLGFGSSPLQINR